MPFRPSLRSVWTLAMLAAVTYGLYIWCETSKVDRKMPHYEVKLLAANLMDRALRTYQESAAEHGVYAENYKDPRLDAIIGQQYSLITTDFSVFENKIIGANPNFAAVAVDLLKQAGVRRGDLVAVGFSGSHPGVNTAVLCACEALGAIPITVTSVGASWWGASDPDFTWLDMEHLLNEKEVVHSRPIAASYGGINDLAVGISQIGQDVMQQAINRNGVAFIHERDVSTSAARRYKLYQEAAAGKPYAAYVNVGNGVASLGHAENGHLIRNGFNRHLPIQNYPARGVVHLFAHDGAPIINLYDIAALSREYGLSEASVPLPQVGEGEVFIAERYDLRVAGISAVLAILLIVVLVQLDARLFKLRDAGVDPDTLM